MGKHGEKNIFLRRRSSKQVGNRCDTHTRDNINWKIRISDLISHELIPKVYIRHFNLNIELHFLSHQLFDDLYESTCFHHRIRSSAHNNRKLLLITRFRYIEIDQRPQFKQHKFLITHISELSKATTAKAHITHHHHTRPGNILIEHHHHKFPNINIRPTHIKSFSK